MVDACNTLTLELNDYYWYCAALDLLWPEAGHAAARLDVLRRLCENSTCYSLGIDKSLGVDAVVNRIVSRDNGVIRKEVGA
jgi:hypothetical protein